MTGARLKAAVVGTVGLAALGAYLILKGSHRWGEAAFLAALLFPWLVTKVAPASGRDGFVDDDKA